MLTKKETKENTMKGVETKKIKKIKIDRNKILSKAKVIFKFSLILIILILSYVASDRIVDYLLSLDIILLKRTLNVIIVTLCVYFIAKKDR